MPCWEVNLISVEFKAKHLDVLEKALQEININYQINKNIINIGNGRVNINLTNQLAEFDKKQQSLVNEIKRAYTRQAVIKASNKKKWILKFHDKNKMIAKKY